MSYVCEVCGKKSEMGNTITHRGKAKYLGGVGTKVTGISRRQFKPNLQRVRISAAGGTHKTVRICTQCIRSGAVTKIVRVAPFRLPASEASVKVPAEVAAASKKAAAKKKPKKS
jgi:large subunit ribosomal protein L28